jgi:hypothetical protein
MTDDVQSSQSLADEISQMMLKPEEPGFYESPGPLPFDKIKSIIGPPPVLSTEDAEAYNNMLLYYMKSVGPRDFLIQMLVKDLVDADWESLRFKRHKAWAIERGDRCAREIEGRRAAAAEGKRIAESKPETENERLFGLEYEVNVLADDAIKAADGLAKPS